MLATTTTTTLSTTTTVAAKRRRRQRRIPMLLPLFFFCLDTPRRGHSVKVPSYQRLHERDKNSVWHAKRQRTSEEERARERERVSLATLSLLSSMGDKRGEKSVFFLFFAPLALALPRPLSPSSFLFCSTRPLSPADAPSSSSHFPLFLSGSNLRHR